MAGFTVDESPRLPDVVELVESNESVILVCDTDHSDWLRVVCDLMAARPGVSPVLLADLETPEEFLAALSAGVAGFCSPDATVDAIVRTVDSVERTGTSIPRSLVSPLVDHVRHGRGRTVHTAAGPIDVTDREWDILRLLLQRRSTREMADALFVSVGTVRSHVSTLLNKLGAVDREDAISLIQRGRHSGGA